MPPESTVASPGSSLARIASPAAESGTAPAVSDAELRSLASGLDRLQTTGERSPGRLRAIAAGVVPPLVFVAVLLVAWQLYVAIAQPRPDIAPGPLDVLSAFGAAWDSGRLQLAVGTSLERGVVGFLIAIAVGTPLGLLLAERPVAPARSLRSSTCNGAAVGRVGSRGDHLVRAVGCHRVLRHPDGRDPLDRRAGLILAYGRRPGAALASPRGHHARTPRRSPTTRIVLPRRSRAISRASARAGRSRLALFLVLAHYCTEIIAMGGTIGFRLGAMLASQGSPTWRACSRRSS